MKRYLVAGMCSMVKFCLYCMRINLNIAIIKMVPNSTENNALNVTLTTKATRSEIIYKEIPSYAWSEETRQMILSAVYYGYSVSALLGGLVTHRLGGKRVILFSLLSSSILTALIPWSAGVSTDLLIVLRVLDGMAQGLHNPAMLIILANWSVAHERSTLVSIAYSGVALAEIICNPLSGWICSAYKLGGWPLSFYTYSTFGAVTAILCIFLIYENPDEDPYISSNEVEYLKSFDTTVGEKNKKISAPWLSILTSSAVWAVVIAFSSNAFGFFFIITEAPIFISEVLKFDVKTIGWLMLILGIVECLFALLSGVCADFIVRREMLTILPTRKLIAICSMGLSAFLLICIGFFQDSAILCLITLILAFGLLGCYNTCFMANVLDITKHYSSVIVGIMTCLASSTGFIGPSLFAALLKKKNTNDQWYLMFKIIAGIQLFGLLIFLLFAKAEEQFHSIEENISKQEMKSYESIKDTE
ncbi:sialin-like [Antedon mediterranea]|uniref:sialin-like n=1 Tax=Antedon mediterranea TaxID=105859 RepID=UPI003AF5D36E